MEPNSPKADTDRAWRAKTSFLSDWPVRRHLRSRYNLTKVHPGTKLLAYSNYVQSCQLTQQSHLALYKCDSVLANLIMHDV